MLLLTFSRRSADETKYIAVLQTSIERDNYIDDNKQASLNARLSVHVAIVVLWLVEAMY